MQYTLQAGFDDAGEIRHRVRPLTPLPPSGGELVVSEGWLARLQERVRADYELSEKLGREIEDAQGDSLIGRGT